MAIAADHPLAGRRRDQSGRLAAFIEECRSHGHVGWRCSRRPRRRVSTPASASCIRFDPNWTLPVYVANFVLMDYGTGAIFGCPSHDQRDLDFARKYGLPVVPVVMPAGADAATFEIGDEAYVDDGVMINSRFLDGMTPAQAFEEVAGGWSGTLDGNRPRASARCSTACATG
jgi:leucyl-tRNA synthetase